MRTLDALLGGFYGFCMNVNIVTFYSDETDPVYFISLICSILVRTYLAYNTSLKGFLDVYSFLRAKLSNCRSQ